MAVQCMQLITLLWVGLNSDNRMAGATAVISTCFASRCDSRNRGECAERDAAQGIFPHTFQTMVDTAANKSARLKFCICTKQTENDSS